MTNETLNIIRARRSVRQFTPQQITAEERNAVLETGQYAPHAGGEAWHFAAVQSAGLLDEINAQAKQVAAQSGLPWLEELGRNEEYNCMYKAPTVIFVSAQENGVSPESDAAAATQTMLLAAESVGLGSCWGFFATLAFDAPQSAALRQRLQIPEGYKVYTSVMLGYKTAPTPPAPLRKEGCISVIE